MRSSSAAFFCMVFPMPSISDSEAEHKIIHANVTNQHLKEKNAVRDTHSVLEFVLGVTLLNTPLIWQIGIGVMIVMTPLIFEEDELPR